MQLATCGALVHETLEAARYLQSEGVAANVLCLTSPGLLYRTWKAASTGGHVKYGQLDTLLPPAERPRADRHRARCGLARARLAGQRPSAQRSRASAWTTSGSPAAGPICIAISASTPSTSRRPHSTRWTERRSRLEGGVPMRHPHRPPKDRFVAIRVAHNRPPVASPIHGIVALHDDCHVGTCKRRRRASRGPERRDRAHAGLQRGAARVLPQPRSSSILRVRGEDRMATFPKREPLHRRNDLAANVPNAHRSDWVPCRKARPHGHRTGPSGSTLTHRIV